MLKDMRLAFILFWALFVLLIVVSLPTASLNDRSIGEITEKENSIETKIVFEPLDMSFYKYESYDLVKLRGCELMRNAGEPALPMKTIYLTIPPTGRIVDIKVLSAEKVEIEGEYNICPAQPPLPTAHRNGEFVAQKTSIYSSSNEYPGKIFKYAGEGNLRGYKIISIILFPIQYTPAQKQLIFYKNITLCINYTISPITAESVTAANQSRFAFIVKKMVLNSDDVDRLEFKPLKQSEKHVKYVIITNDDLKDAYQPLVDWKTKKGLPAKIVTVSYIEGNYSGSDTQEKIRNFIKDACIKWDTDWVLLGGDTDVVPSRGGYGNVSGYAALGEWTDNNIPADLYYADLDGDWNADNDSIYGEVNDSIDLCPDLFVGRAPVNTVEEVQAFVDKTLTYERNPPMDYELDILFLAEKLWDDPETYGGMIKNVIDTDHIPPKYDPVTKKYQMYGNASAEIAISEMDAGPHIINHVGHGNTNFFSVNGYVWSSDADGLTNHPRNFILYTISCYSNAFDSDSLSEHFMNNPNGGTIAYIGNSRYGFFTPGSPGDGPSDLYDRQFFNSLFDDGFYHLGEAIADSKIAYIAQSQEDGDGMRWLQYAINLLGDPELPIWTDIPQNFTINKPTVIENTTQTILIQVLNGTEPVWNATVCIVKEDDSIYSVSETDSSGNVNFSISPSVGTLNVTVTKHNFLPNESTILVTEDNTPPMITIFSPLNGTTYNTSSIDLNYTINEQTVWEGYSLDGGENITLNGNKTLIGLTNGMHNLTVYANDTAGNMGNSSMIWFSVNAPAVGFDTGSPTNPYPSISGTHNGTLKPNQTITVSKLYTYPCPGTGGHTEYIKIWNYSGFDVNATWNGYVGDWHNISFNEPFTLLANEKYNYSIRTGSYPQIHHTDALPTANGWINCTSFVDANGRVYKDWIPAIRLWAE